MQRLPLSVIMLSLGSLLAGAQPSPSPGPTGVAPAATESTDLGAYVDGLAEAFIAREPIPGLIVSVVRDDRMLLARGYGVASMTPRVAVDPAATMFRIGSISKTFTYTAVMQLVAEGRLSLDDLANDRLPSALALPADGWSEPIRIRHLITHTAGFEDSALGHLFYRDAGDVPTPESYLVAHRPKRVRAPGVTAVYSNYGVAVLGAIIANVSGMSFPEYVEQRLTGPLGMTNATFREPLSAGNPRGLAAARAAAISAGFERRAGAFETAPVEFISHVAAAGSMSASAADMARWMRMHLNAGVLDGVRVLPEATALGMREVMFSNAPQTGGIAHGFLTRPLGSHRSWGHGGATLYFHSQMLMVPEQGVGVFVSVNSSNARRAADEIANLILKRMLDDLQPQAALDVAAAAVSSEALARYAGVYRSNRRPYSSVEKLFLGPMSDATVTAASDGTLRITAGGETSRWLPIGPDAFRNADDGDRLQFLAGPDGKPDRYVAGFGADVMERILPLDRLQLLVLVSAAALLIVAGRLASAVWQLRRRATLHPSGRRGLASLSTFVAATWLLFFGTFVYAVMALGSEGQSALFSYPSTSLRWSLWFAAAAALATLFELFSLPIVWRQEGRTWQKLRRSAAVLVLVAAAFLLWRWNVLAWPPALSS